MHATCAIVNQHVTDVLECHFEGGHYKGLEGMGGVSMGVAVPMGTILGSRICRFILKSV